MTYNSSEFSYPDGIFKSIVQNASNLIFILDNSGHFVYTNEACNALISELNEAASESRMSFLDLVGDNYNHIDELIIAHSTKPAPLEISFQNQRKVVIDGELLKLSDVEGQDLVVGIFTDVTTKKELLKDLIHLMSSNGDQAI